MKFKLVKLKYDGDGDGVIDILVDYIYQRYDGFGCLQYLIDGFNDEHNVVDIIDSYYYSGDDEVDDSDEDDDYGGIRDDDYEWIKFSMYGKKYIISAFDDDYNGFKFIYSKRKDNDEIFYVYKEDVN